MIDSFNFFTGSVVLFLTPNEDPRVCIWRLQFVPNPLNAPLGYLQLLQRAPCQRGTLRVPTQCHLHGREYAHPCFSYNATPQGACFSLPFSPSFIDLARKPSARRIIPRHPNATSTPQQGGSAPTPPYNSRMISAVRQSRTTPRRLAAIHSQPRSGPDHVMLDSSLLVDSSMPRSTER